MKRGVGRASVGRGSVGGRMGVDRCAHLAAAPLNRPTPCRPTLGRHHQPPPLTGPHVHRLHDVDELLLVVKGPRDLTSGQGRNGAGKEREARPAQLSVRRPPTTQTFPTPKAHRAPSCLVVVAGAQVDHDVLVAEEKHDRHWVVQLVHRVKVGHGRDVDQIDDGKVFDGVRDGGQDLGRRGVGVKCNVAGARLGARAVPASRARTPPSSDLVHLHACLVVVVSKADDDGAVLLLRRGRQGVGGGVGRCGRGAGGATGGGPSARCTSPLPPRPATGRPPARPPLWCRTTAPPAAAATAATAHRQDGLVHGVARVEMGQQVRHGAGRACARGGRCWHACHFAHTSPAQDPARVSTRAPNPHATMQRLPLAAAASRGMAVAAAGLSSGQLGTAQCRAEQSSVDDAGSGKGAADLVKARLDIWIGSGRGYWGGGLAMGGPGAGVARSLPTGRAPTHLRAHPRARPRPPRPPWTRYAQGWR